MTTLLLLLIFSLTVALFHLTWNFDSANETRERGLIRFLVTTCLIASCFTYVGVV